MSHMLLTWCMVFKHALQEILLVLWYLATLATAPLPCRPYQTSALNLNLQKLNLEGACEDEDWFRLCLHLKGLSHTSKCGPCIQWLIRPKTEQFGGQRLRNDVRNGCRQDRREAGVQASTENPQGRSQCQRMLEAAWKTVWGPRVGWMAHSQVPHTLWLQQGAVWGPVASVLGQHTHKIYQTTQ